jgi:pimeloyl-ACP methyl ester carboxylesterase
MSASLSASSAVEIPASANDAAATTLHYLISPEGGRIAYEDAGTGAIIVLVPSLGDLRQEYRFLRPRLLAAGFRVLAMDIRGHGDSSTGWRDHSSAALGRDILALVRAVGAGPAIIVGTSMGGGAAAWAAAESPGDVAGLVLISPFARNVPMPWWKTALLQTVMRTAFIGPWAPRAWGAYYASLYPTKPTDFAQYRAALVANLKQPGRLAALQAMLRAGKEDVEARLGEVRAPTLVVMGSRDPDFPDPAAEGETLAGLLHGRSHVLPGVGHYPQVEAPEATAELILEFLARHGAN